MLTIDIVAMVAAAVFLLGGILLGFGATLKLLTGGLVGKIDEEGEAVDFPLGRGVVAFCGYRLRP